MKKIFIIIYFCVKFFKIYEYIKWLKLFLVRDVSRVFFNIYVNISGKKYVVCIFVYCNIIVIL